jgi:selenide,water dikinase
LVGFDDYDDAGVFRTGDGLALVQTMDFFTPIVDDPYAYGAIAAANALSDVYAMGGKPITAMNIACFDPTMAEPELWAAILKGMADKCAEAGAAVVGGHSVEDSQPKFGLSVTGLVDANKMMTNSGAKAGDKIYLSKPIGTGIVTTAAKYDACPAAVLSEAISVMSTLNRDASEMAVRAGSKCATDITGFGLVGHCYNVARASSVSIRIDTSRVPLIKGLRPLVDQRFTTGGAVKNREFLGEALAFETSDEFVTHVVCDPQTSGGLAIFSSSPISEHAEIGEVTEGPATVTVY